MKLLETSKGLFGFIECDKKHFNFANVLFDDNIINSIIGWLDEIDIFDLFYSSNYVYLVNDFNYSNFHAYTFTDDYLKEYRHNNKSLIISEIYANLELNFNKYYLVVKCRKL